MDIYNLFEKWVETCSAHENCSGCPMEGNKEVCGFIMEVITQIGEKDIINKWVKTCQMYEDCAKCPIGNATGGGIECSMLFAHVRSRAEKLDEVQSIIEKVGERRRMNMSETIKKWDEMCHTYNHCTDCLLHNRFPDELVSSGIQCMALREKLGEIADVLKTVEGAAAEWEKEQ